MAVGKDNVASIAAGLNGSPLVLHVDLRNTIIVADSVSNVSVEQCLNSYLSTVAWGTVDDEGEWRWLDAQYDHMQGHITKPVKNAISYYTFMEQKTSHDKQLKYKFRQTLGNFTEEHPKLRKLYTETLEKLRVAPENATECLTIGGEAGQVYHYILTSFLHLISELYKSKIVFKIILRTYGLDAHNVLNALRNVARGSHSDFGKMPNIEISTESSKMVRTHAANGDQHFTLHRNDKIYTTSEDIMDVFNEFTWEDKPSIEAVVDDYLYWMDAGFAKSAGKPIWIDCGNNSYNLSPVHIFLDDNIRHDAPDSIVDVRCQCEVQCDMDTDKTARRRLIQVDLVSAIHTRKYFIELLGTSICDKI